MKNPVTLKGWCIGNGQVAQLELHEKCLCLNCMHDPMAVMVRKNMNVIANFEGNGSRPSHHGPGIQVDGQKMYTLNGTEVHGVVTERRSMKYLEKDGTPIEDEEREVERVKEINEEHSDDDVEYDVRRLTPIECARLQGFPPDWCADVPHSDSAEYKLWGNGIALPSILGIMQNAVRIVKEYKDEHIQ